MNTIQTPEPAWPLWKKFVFRFVFCYMAQVILWTFFSFIFSNTLKSMYAATVNWVSGFVLHVDYIYPGYSTGSGDTTGNYVWVFFRILVSLLASLIWALLDAKRDNYRLLAKCLMVGSRYYLGFVMLGYGYAKIFQLQFSAPGMMRLLQRFGDASPMGLAWTYMGFSPAYNIFAGSLEAIGGTLLFFRRTTTLGAAILTPVLINIVMMNLCFDIPVKLNSSIYLFIAIGLIYPDIVRLFKILILNRATEPRKFEPLFANRRLHWGTHALKWILILALSYYNISRNLEGLSKWGRGRPKSPLYGLYEVETQIKNGEDLPALITDESRWRYVFFEWEGTFGLQTIQEQFGYFPATLDVETKTMTIALRGNREFVWTYEQPDPDTLIMKGPLFGNEHEIKAKRKNIDDFLLISRGFHWVSEYPYNR